MKATDILKSIEAMGIEVITGVPDSTLKQFCDGVLCYNGKLRHYVAVDEGGAVALGVGSYLASGKPACVYMQNSGIGNAVNPLVSLANTDVYGIPMLFVVGWRGEPGKKDEPQHAFQGKITCELFSTMDVDYSVIDSKTSLEELGEILGRAHQEMKKNRQYAIIVKKGTFEPAESLRWENGSKMVREEVLGELLQVIPQDAVIVSTTGKISRELYEQSDKLFGNHESIFMTVGGMGHASMIAYGIAQSRPEQKVVCIDGDGAALMHMGAMAFIASQAPENLFHIVINNQAHESVGGMPTSCQQTSFAKLAQAAGYVQSERIDSMEEIVKIGQNVVAGKGPMMFEIPVSLASREDLGRPRESAEENKIAFMRHLNRER